MAHHPPCLSVLHLPICYFAASLFFSESPSRAGLSVHHSCKFNGLSLRAVGLASPQPDFLKHIKRCGGGILTALTALQDFILKHWTSQGSNSPAGPWQESSTESIWHCSAFGRVTPALPVASLRLPLLHEAAAPGVSQ